LLLDVAKGNHIRIMNSFVLVPKGKCSAPRVSFSRDWVKRRLTGNNPGILLASTMRLTQPCGKGNKNARVHETTRKIAIFIQTASLS